MKITNLNCFLGISGWLAGSLFMGGSTTEAAQAAGLPAVSERVAVLEALVTQQSNQIAALMHALSAEAAARQAADAALQAQINSLQPPPFSATEITTLQGLANVVTVGQSDIHVAASICVGGNISVSDGQTLFVSHIQPSGSGCLGNRAGITVFDGNVGIQATNTLFVNNLNAFQAIPLSPQELLEFEVSMPPFTLSGTGTGTTVIMYGPVLFRSDK